MAGNEWWLGALSDLRRRHRRPGHRLCAGAPGLSGARVRAVARIPRGRRRHPARPQYLPRAGEDRPQGRRAGRRPPPAGAGNARRADRQADHPASRSTPTFIKRFGQPYAVTHRADIHGTFLKACQGSNLITLETSRRVDGYEDHGDRVTVTLENGERVEGRALIGCDGMWSKIRERIVGDGKPRVSGHIAYRAVLKRERGARRTCGGPTSCCGPARAATSCIIRCAAANSTIWSRCSIPTITRKAGTPKAARNCCGSTSRACGRKCCACSSASRPGACGCCATASR